MMYYLYLALAIIFEVIGSSFIKMSDGFTRLFPTLAVAAAYLVCFYFLSLALRGLSLGVAYAIWGGLGIVLTTVISVVVFKQHIDLPAIIGVLMIVGGGFVLNFFSKAVVH